MQQMTVKELFKGFAQELNVKLIGLATGGSMLVMAASAEVDINGTISPLIDDLVLLVPSIVSLIVAILPAIIVMAIVGFIVGFFDKILGMLKL